MEISTKVLQKKKLKIELSYDPATPGHISERM
jgi:hypothetical protein